MGSKLDLTGQKYGFLTVIEEDFEAEELAVAKGRRKRSVWKCICDCGNTFSVLGESLRSGKTESCGCYRKAKVSETFKKYNNTIILYHIFSFFSNFKGSYQMIRTFLYQYFIKK